jgi:hypothetical protein
MASQTNPSRQLEVVATDLVNVWLGQRGIATHTGDGGENDFEIAYLDGDYGIGEVKVDFNPNRQDQWSAIHRQPSPQTIPLLPQAGIWAARVDYKARIKSLTNEIPRLINDLIAAGITSIDTHDEWPPSQFAERARTHGIEYIYLTPQAGPDCCIFLVAGISGTVPTDANDALPWIQQLVQRQRFQNSWARLEVSDAREKHVFLWIENGTPAALQFRASFNPNEPPTGSPKVPNWLTHVWVGINAKINDQVIAWVHSRDEGWVVVRKTQAVE